MLYSEKTLRYYENLKNIGELNDNLKNVGTGIVGSPLCGDVMKLQIFFGEDGRIQDAKYKVFGCVSAIASMELATTILKGLTIDEALKIRNEDVADSLELSVIKRHCSVLAKEAIESAINNYLAKQQESGVKMITVTDGALKKLRELIDEQNAKGITITAEENGCSGFQYSLSYETDSEGDGKEKKNQIVVDGISFFYESEIEPIINGLSIDIVESILGPGFTVTNKNQSTCQNCTCGRKRG
jgi:nitrogen fixation NifU-like protein